MLLALAGCTTGIDGEPLSRHAEQIAGGELDHEHRAVFGMVVRKEHIATCTATLIAPNLVLTARHCVSPTNEEETVVCGDSPFGEPVHPDNLYVSNDTIPTATTKWIRGAAVRVPDNGNDTCGFDVALVILAENVSPEIAEPAIPRIDRPVTRGEPYIAVGYGVDETGVSPGRQVLTGLEVACNPGSCGSGVRVTEFRGDRGVCVGDSGGPALDQDGKVVGVVSRGGENCTTPVYGMVSSWRELIIDVALEAAELGGYEPLFWTLSGSSEPEDEPPVSPPVNPEPTGTGTQGDACEGPADCRADHVCFLPSRAERAFCVELCETDAECGSGLACSDVNDGGVSVGVCLEADAPDEPSPATLPADGGCTLASGRSGEAGWLGAMVLAGLGMVRRRRRGRQS
ncbi:MAG TPA: S1 family peptidase [Polyangiaceae bacterium]|nr:S1 family peptidase [Polyangiaceae bacterium]